MDPDFDFAAVLIGNRFTAPRTFPGWIEAYDASLNHQTSKYINHPTAWTIPPKMDICNQFVRP
eukprot:6438847-Amphidinium_carterae.1